MIKNSLIIWLLLFAPIGCAEAPKYTREECIVRINIDWSNTPSSDKESLIRLITDSIRRAPDMGFNKISASSAIQGNDREFIYYQYNDDCKNRLENTEKLLDYVRKNTTGIPSISVDPGDFEPGVETIRLSGPWWKDREEPVGKRVVIDGEEYNIVE